MRDGGVAAWFETNPQAVRMLTPDGRVLTLVGSDGGTGDGPFGTASVTGLRDIATAPDGRLFVLDAQGVRIVDVAHNNVTTLIGDAGTLGVLDAPLAMAVGKGPNGIDVLYVADGRTAGATSIVRYVLPGGPVVTFANDAGAPVSSMLADNDGGVYFWEVSSGESHVAFMDWSGTINQARFNPAANTSVTQMAFDLDGGIFYASSNALYRFNLNAKLADGGAPTAARVFVSPIVGYADGIPPDGMIYGPTGLVIDGERYLLLDATANRLRQMRALH
jgi:hypothetical protein